ncbi:hypothetical protein WG68_05060 [Arsukibacterium ikkense]|uniref:Uncharacterized protein n=1 Tax=Arsukibacterium ikkense TaxID=336831 RepID=A0A0M2VAK0_9GAMM|nr:hypothetical protein [Arsukibacterium ikkense]KKO46655.1 hypothetical protein WG68_05060 [Arsukibacterium ikkense]
MPNWVSLCCGFLLLTACQPAPVDHSSHLLFQRDTILLSLSPASAPVETPLILRISSGLAIEAISADVAGVNMFMGRIPLRFQKLTTQKGDEAEQWQAEFLLGACSDPAMLWQLNVTLQFADGTKLILNERFSSSW